MSGPAVVIVTENNVPKNVILVKNGELAEQVFKELCEDTFRHTPTDEDFDNGYVEEEAINMSVAISWPEIRE